MTKQRGLELWAHFRGWPDPAAVPEFFRQFCDAAAALDRRFQSRADRVRPTSPVAVVPSVYRGGTPSGQTAPQPHGQQQFDFPDAADSADRGMAAERPAPVGGSAALGKPIPMLYPVADEAEGA